jgi:hypothetical protein
MNIIELKELIGTKTVIHCKTKKKADELYAMLVKANYYWVDLPKNDSRWDVHGDGTVYYLHSDELRYSDIKYVDTKKYKVIVM